MSLARVQSAYGQCLKCDDTVHSIGVSINTTNGSMTLARLGPDATGSPRRHLQAVAPSGSLSGAGTSAARSSPVDRQTVDVRAWTVDLPPQKGALSGGTRPVPILGLSRIRFYDRLLPCCGRFSAGFRKTPNAANLEPVHLIRNSTRMCVGSVASYKL